MAQTQTRDLLGADLRDVLQALDERHDLRLIDEADPNLELGAITEIREQPSELAPFVTRDSVYKFILGTFDAAATSLASGGVLDRFVPLHQSAGEAPPAAIGLPHDEHAAVRPLDDANGADRERRREESHEHPPQVPGQ